MADVVAATGVAEATLTEPTATEDGLMMAVGADADTDTAIVAVVAAADIIDDNDDCTRLLSKADLTT
jgi:hypothetical protein